MCILATCSRIPLTLGILSGQMPLILTVKVELIRRCVNVCFEMYAMAFTDM